MAFHYDVPDETDGVLNIPGAQNRTNRTPWRSPSELIRVAKRSTGQRWLGFLALM